MKKTKTKLLAVLLTAAMGALTACGGSGSSETTAAASGESQAAETTAAVELQRASPYPRIPTSPQLCW